MPLTAEQLVKGIENVASLPTIYQRLNEVVNDSRSSNRDVARILSEDAGLAARLLRVANSAFYGHPARIDNIARAVTVLGTRQLRDLTLATTVMDLFPTISSAVVNMESFWRHSVACGVTARIIATYRREINIERFFVAGLLHDIGRIVLLMELPVPAGRAVEQARLRDEPLWWSEGEVLGFDHSAVGAALLTRWDLPAETVNAIAYHHQPECAPEAMADAATIHVADFIVHALQLGATGELCVPPLIDQAWDCLGLPQSVVAAIVAELDRQYREAVELVLPAAA